MKTLHVNKGILAALIVLVLVLAALPAPVMADGGPATHFTVSAPGVATTGTAISVTVTALDATGALANEYEGTIHFTSTDGSAVLPANSQLANGVGTFSVTFQTVGTQTITASDTVTSSITGTSGPIVVSGPATHIAVSAPASATGSVSFTFTVTAQDAFGNTATGYAGTVHFTSTDAIAVLPADAALISGTRTFSATLKTGGSQTITATDTVTPSITGTSATVVVTILQATHFSVVAPATATAGSSFSFTVTALDANNNIVLNYPGTAHFTSTDPGATLPADTTLTSGTGTFPATLITSGSRTITATDTIIATLTGTSNTITVSPAAASHFTVVAPGSVSSGSSFSVTVTTLDQFNNIATGYAGTVHFTSTDGTATLPADSVLTSGTGAFSAILRPPGPRQSQRLTRSPLQ